jgi:hypothetical protein
MFIDKYFDKQNLWKLPPLLEMVAPALFKEEYEKGQQVNINFEV